MKKLEKNDPTIGSGELGLENTQKLKALFPDVVTEGPNGTSVNVDVLKALVGDGTVTDCDEKYGLNWHGKRRARQAALTSSAGTLLPKPEDSMDWETTRNLMIEGDNLEALKLLRKSYSRKIRMIYIDPPYNTGEDFVYRDDYRDSLRNYLRLTQQVSAEGTPLTSNTEASGRFHTDWMNMMYPRLKLAHELLRTDGAIFVSIDDVEVAHLRLLCDEIFGPENFIAEVVWEGANKNDARQIGICHEYVLVYAKNRESLPRYWDVPKEAVEPVLKEVQRLKEEHGDDYKTASKELAGWFRAMKAKPSFAHRRFRKIDTRGAYKEDDPTAPGGRKFELKDPRTGTVIPLRKNRGWGFDQAEFNRLVDEGRITFVTPTSIMVRRYLHETDMMTPQSVFYQPARSASERLEELMGTNVFGFPKDETVLQKFVEMATDAKDTDCIVLDFFAGSGTTAHAVMAQNAIDGGNRRYILVQLPEPIDPDSNAQKAAAAFCDKLKKPRNIAELTKERLRQTAKAVKKEHPGFKGDLGFRTFTLDASNIQAWNPDPDNLGQTLALHTEHLLPNRSEPDILYELLLKRGLDLCMPIEKRKIVTKDVYAVSGGTLIACLSEKISRKDAEPLALGIVTWHKSLSPEGDTTCVFRDSAFADDVAKANLTAILEQNGIKNVRSL